MSEPKLRNRVIIKDGTEGSNLKNPGWECPRCNAVYSPNTMQCFNCTGIVVSSTEGTKK